MHECGPRSGPAGAAARWPCRRRRRRAGRACNGPRRAGWARRRSRIGRPAAVRRPAALTRVTHPDVDELILLDTSTGVGCVHRCRHENSGWPWCARSPPLAEGGQPSVTRTGDRGLSLPSSGEPMESARKGISARPVMFSVRGRGCSGQLAPRTHYCPALAGSWAGVIGTRASPGVRDGCILLCPSLAVEGALVSRCGSFLVSGCRRSGSGPPGRRSVPRPRRAAGRLPLRGRSARRLW